MPSYNPAEDAYKAGKSSISAEQAVGLGSGILPDIKEKIGALKQLIKMMILGRRYKSPQADLPPAARDK